MRLLHHASSNLSAFIPERMARGLCTTPNKRPLPVIARRFLPKRSPAITREIASLHYQGQPLSLSCCLPVRRRGSIFFALNRGSAKKDSSLPVADRLNDYEASSVSFRKEWRLNHAPLAMTLLSIICQVTKKIFAITLRLGVFRCFDFFCICDVLNKT